MNSKPQGMRWLLLLVLPSAAGLLGFGVWGLFESSRGLRVEVVEESRNAARAEARALRSSLLEPGFLAKLPEEMRFRFDEQQRRVILPEGHGPLAIEDLRAPRPAQLSWVAMRRMEDALRREFADADPKAAMDLLEDGLARSRDDEDRGAALNRLAWCAERASEVERRDAALDRLLALDGAASEDRLSGLLLAAVTTRSGDIIAKLVAMLMTMPSGEVGPIAQRAEELDKGSASLIDFMLSGRIAYRDGARRVQAALERLGEFDEGRLEALGNEVLVLLPEGRAALIAPELAIEYAGFEPERFHIGAAAVADAPEEAIEALPLVKARVAKTERGFGNESLFTFVLVGGLAVAFVGGLLLALRALRREALAAQARSEFLTSVTHELKTPLASIRLIAEMLEEGLVKGEEKRAEYQRLLSGETARLTMLIENVLDLGRMERGERAYDRRDEVPGEVVRAAVTLFRPVAERHDMRIEDQLSVNGARAHLDRGALVQALLNLLENARKYAAEGERIELKDESKDGVYRLQVRDFGEGIVESEREAVFERFRRGAKQQDGSIAGVGLGLHLARRIVEDQGGRLRAVAPPDGGPGACFEMDLPLVEDDE